MNKTHLFSIIVLSVLIIGSYNARAAVTNSNPFITQDYNVYVINGLVQYDNAIITYTNSSPINSSLVGTSLFNGTAVLQYQIRINNTNPITLNLNITDNGTSKIFKILWQTPINNALLFLYEHANSNYSVVQSELDTIINYRISGCGTNDYCSYVNDYNASMNYLKNNWSVLNSTQRLSYITPYLQPKFNIITPIANITDGQRALVSLTNPYNGILTIGRNDTNPLNASFHNDTYYDVYADRDYIIINTNKDKLTYATPLRIYSDPNNTIFDIVVFFGFLSLLFLYFSNNSNQIFYRLGLLVLSSLMAINSYIIGTLQFSKVYGFSSTLNIIPALILLAYGTATIIFVYVAFAIIPGMLFYNGYIKKLVRLLFKTNKRSKK